MITLSALLMAALTARLGMWQLDRAEQKLDWGAHRRAAVVQRWKGVWAAQQTQYMDNQQMRGRYGFYVHTPLLLSEAAYVLVQRGWIERNFQNRVQLQPIQTPAGTVEIEARVLPGAEVVLPPGEGVSAEHPIVQYVDVHAITQQLRRQYPDIALYALVQQVGPASEGLERLWPQPQVDVSKHYGYAVQWFALCGLVLVLYLWFLVKRLRQGRAAAA